jgi:hypothetical protein
VRAQGGFVFLECEEAAIASNILCAQFGSRAEHPQDGCSHIGERPAANRTSSSKISALR